MTRSSPTSRRQIRLFELPFDEDTLWRIAEVLDSGMVMQGPRVEELEARVADWMGVAPRQVVAMSTGSAALEYALSVTPRKGFKVLLPGLCFIADVHAIERAGLVPKFVDVGASLQVNVEILEEAYSEDLVKEGEQRIGGVLVVDYAGLPTDMRSIRKWADERELLVWQDCAHSFGCAPQGAPSGKLADFACYSMYPTKPLPALGGGLFLNNLGSNPSFHDMAREWRYYGMGGFKVEGYEVRRPGGNHYLTDISASVALQFLGEDPKVSEFNRIRRLNASRYHVLLEDLGIRERFRPPRYECDNRVDDATFHLFPIVLAPGIDRNKLQLFLKEKGIDSGTHYKPPYMFELYQHSEKANTPHLDSIGSRLLTLPCHHKMLYSDVQYVVEALGEHSRKLK